MEVRFSLLLLLVCLFNLTQTLYTSTKDPIFVRKFQVTHIAPGDGKTSPKQGEVVKLHYHGYLAKNGQKFDSSWDENHPFLFTLGKGEVILCWDEVIPVMTLKERIKFTCPADLAYGEGGSGGSIPPDADLIYEVEILEIISMHDEM